MSEPQPQDSPETPAVPTPSAARSPHSRYLACYQAGRLANLFRWHLSKARLLGTDWQRRQVGLVLDELEALLPAFDWNAARVMDEELRSLRQRVVEKTFSETASDRHTEYEITYSCEDISSTELCDRLVATYVAPLVEDLIQALSCPLQGRLLAALRLGVCVDEGVRRPDVYLYMERPPSSPACSDRKDNEVEEIDWAAAEAAPPEGTACLGKGKPIATYSPQPGELRPRKSWLRSVKQIAAELDIDVTLPADTVSSRTDKTANRMLRVKKIDEQIQLGLQKLADRWYHDVDEEPPSEFKYGPLEDQKKNLAQWVLPDEGKKDPRSFENQCCAGLYWCRQTGGTSFELYFKTAQKFEQAKANKASASSRPKPKSAPSTAPSES